MSYRTVVVTHRCKLDLRMNYLEIRQVDDKKRVLMDEISTLILENPAISLTGCLLSALLAKKVNIILCDSQHNPQGTILPLAGSHDSTRKIRQQLSWNTEQRGLVWTAIVKEKIRQQSLFLQELEKKREAELLESYLTAIRFKDETNREGHAAKVYFNALFGLDFTRDADIPTNSALNYGYALLLSLINREICACGYLLQLGLFHDNIFNPFNLSCDLMEPFRILVDRYVKNAEYTAFGTEEKHDLLNILNQEVQIKNTKQVLPNAVKIYVKSVFQALNQGDVSALEFYRV
ncbi:MAG: CRISPR-associated endonuclease Cas1 [Succiniclasticum sp.]|jgi:CRISP-associated protein Cas1